MVKTDEVIQIKLVILTLFYTSCSTNTFYTGREQNATFLTPEPKITETSNLAYGLEFTKIFEKKRFRVDEVITVTS